MIPSSPLGPTWTRWPRRGTWTWTRSCPRTNGGSAGWPARADAITAHHERRLAELLAAVRRHPGATPWELAGQLTWSRPWAEYGGQMRIFAVTETAAHVDLLDRRGLVTASETRPPGYAATVASMTGPSEVGGMQTASCSPPRTGSASSR